MAIIEYILAEREGFGHNPTANQLAIGFGPASTLAHSCAGFPALQTATGSFHPIGFECTFHSNLKTPHKSGVHKLAEREGFEPSVPLPARRFSRPFPSTTRTPLLNYRCTGSYLGFDPPLAGPKLHD